MKKLSLEKMNQVQGSGRWQDCAVFAGGIAAMFHPVTAIGGLITVAASAGDCESYLGW